MAVFSSPLESDSKFSPTYSSSSPSSFRPSPSRIIAGRTSDLPPASDEQPRRSFSPIGFSDVGYTRPSGFRHSASSLLLGFRQKPDSRASALSVSPLPRNIISLTSALCGVSVISSGAHREGVSFSEVLLNASSRKTGGLVCTFASQGSAQVSVRGLSSLPALIGARDPRNACIIWV